MTFDALVDTAALRKRLAEYDPNREKCDGFLEHRTNMAPDEVREGDPEYHDYDLVLRNPCCRPKGHEGPCRNSRPIMGWPGAKTLEALISEVEHLRSRISTCRYCGQSVVEGAGGHTSGCYEIKLNELKRIVALERGDESAALPGWHWNQHALHWWSDDGWSIWRGNGSSWQTWLGRTKQDYTRRGDLDDDCPIEFDGSKSFHTVWDAMNAKPSLKA